MRRIKSFALALALVIFLVTGCVETPKPIRVAGVDWLGNKFFLAMLKSGIETQQTLKIAEFSTADRVSEALVSGVVDVAAFTLDEALALAGQGHDLTVVMILSVSNGSNQIVSRYQSLNDAIHGPIGLEFNTTSGFVLHRAMEIEGIDPSRVEKRYITKEDQLESFATGKIDTVVAYEPFIASFLEAGGNSVFSTERMKCEVISVLVVKSNQLDMLKPSLVRLYESWHQMIQLKERDRQTAYSLLYPKAIPEKLDGKFNQIVFPDPQQSKQLITSNKFENALSQIYLFNGVSKDRLNIELIGLNDAN